MFTPPPDSSFKADDWNRVEVLVDADVFRSNVNGRGSAVAIDGTTGNFGPIALYAGGSGEVRFKELAIKDLAGRADRVAVPCPALRGLLPWLVSRGWRFQPRRRGRRDHR